MREKWISREDRIIRILNIKLKNARKLASRADGTPNAYASGKVAGFTEALEIAQAVKQGSRGYIEEHIEEWHGRG